MDAKKRDIRINPRYERWRWQVFAITWLAYAGFYLTRKAFSVAKIGMEKAPSAGGIGLSEHNMAWIDGSYLAAYAVGQFIWGMAADKVGTRKVVLAGLFGSVLAAVAMGASTWVIVLGIFFCIQGLCQSTGWGPLTKNVGNFFSQHERGAKIGLWSTCYAVGGLVASAYAGYWADELGDWRYAFYGPAATLFVIFILFWIFQRNKPEDVGLEAVEDYHGEARTVIEEGEAAEEEPEGSWKVIWEVMTNRTVLTLCAVYFLLKPTRYAILFWGPKYIHDRLGSNMTNSGIVSGLFEAAGIVSCILGGWISDKVFKAKRMPVCVICLLALGVFMFFFNRLPATYWMMSFAFLLTGMLLYAPDSIISGTAALDFGTRKGASTAAGLVNGFGSVAAIIGGVLPGFSKDTSWGWNGVFGFLGGMVIVAGLILLPKWNSLPPKEKSNRRNDEEPAAK